ncbi:MAG: hypothetical protein HY236_06965 [Acidobacteria bacterium]|nr:hypothetical protein [Acidobacteriota bacterium]
MKFRGFGILAGAVLFAAAAFAQMQGFYSGYLDIAVVKVRPEKRAEFDAINKKMADANRKNKGDNWIASERRAARPAAPRCCRISTTAL